MKTETLEIQQKSQIEVSSVAIRDLISIVRGKQVMLDSDLARLYRVETSALNRAVKRNKERFPEDFCFQLTENEFLTCQIGISKNDSEIGRGGRRYLPYVFTEQGISMLSAVLHSDVAVKVSIGIMRAFVEMRKILANNFMIVSRINDMEVRQLQYQKITDEKFDQVFKYIEDHAESQQKIFFAGQIYDAFSLIVSIIQKAEREIVLIDNYVDVDTLNLLSKKAAGVKVTIYTHSNTMISDADIAKFNSQYPSVEVKKASLFHDRFIILDGKTAYHCGASLKDAGKKCFAISLWQETEMVTILLDRLKIL